MTFNDLVRYMTQQFVTYLDKPKDQRMQLKNDRKSNQPPVLSKWFGILPLSFMLIMKKNREKKGKL